MRLTMLLILIIPNICVSQIYMRKKQNIGVYGGGTLNAGQFNNATFGLTRSMLHYFEPEIGLRASLANGSLEQNKSLHFTSALNVRKSIFRIFERKRGRSCRGEVIEVFVAPEYNLLLKSSTDRMDKGQFSIRGGLGIFHYQTGFSKRSKAWNVKAQCYYRYVPGPITSTQSIQNEIGVQLRIFRFKTYDFVK